MPICVAAVKKAGHPGGGLSAALRIRRGGGERIIAEGKADIVSMGRQMIAGIPILLRACSGRGMRSAESCALHLLS